jgi:hypothetical protein
MLDDGVCAGEHQALVAIVKPHQEGRPSVFAAHLEDLRCAIWLSDVVGLHDQSLANLGLHGDLLDWSATIWSIAADTLTMPETALAGKGPWATGT